MRSKRFIYMLCLLSVTACSKTSEPTTHAATQSKPAPQTSSLCSDWKGDAVEFAKMYGSGKGEEAAVYYTFAAKCVHEKAFLLAPGTDSAEIISEAVPDLCQGEILQWQGVTSGFNEQGAESAAIGFKKMAILEVLRARAGHCAAPVEISN